VRPAIASSSVYVLPSYYREGTPHTILEAMSMGRPVITTDAPGCRETVQEGRNGFLVQVRDVKALVRAIEKFINDPQLINEMGKQSRKVAVEKYNVRKVNAVILETMGL
jgi:glycosyltransferase involved in cell wall biosynthesis